MKPSRSALLINCNILFSKYKNNITHFTDNIIRLQTPYYFMDIYRSNNSSIFFSKNNDIFKLLNPYYGIIGLSNSLIDNKRPYYIIDIMNLYIPFIKFNDLCNAIDELLTGGNIYDINIKYHKLTINRIKLLIVNKDFT